EGLEEQVVERAAALGFLLHPCGLAREVGVGERLHLRLELVDARDLRPRLLELALVLGADELSNRPLDHGFFFTTTQVRSPRAPRGLGARRDEGAGPSPPASPPKLFRADEAMRRGIHPLATRAPGGNHRCPLSMRAPPPPLPALPPRPGRWLWTCRA